MSDDQTWLDAPDDANYDDIETWETVPVVTVPCEDDDIDDTDICEDCNDRHGTDSQCQSTQTRLKGSHNEPATHP